jgi:hypothetical protein
MGTSPSGVKWIITKILRRVRVPLKHVRIAEELNWTANEIMAESRVEEAAGGDKEEAERVEGWLGHRGWQLLNPKMAAHVAVEVVGRVHGADQF